MRVVINFFIASPFKWFYSLQMYEPYCQTAKKISEQAFFNSESAFLG